MLNRLFLLILPLLFSSFAWSQNFFFRQYTVSDGLPSNTVYALDQDSHQMLWMGTGNGIAKFDGKNFHSYSTEDGLINILVYGLTVDHLDRKWMSTVAGRPSYFLHGKGTVPSWADTLHVGNYYFQSIDTFLWFSGQNADTKYKPRKLAQIQSDGTLKKLSKIVGDQSRKAIVMDSSLYFMSDGKLYKEEKGNLVQVEDLSVPAGLDYCQAYDDGMICIERYGVGFDSLIYIDILAKTITPLEQLTPYLEQWPINAFLVDKAQQIWVATNKGLLFLENREAPVNYLLKNAFVNELYQDHEENLWVSTEGKGLFFLVSSKVRSLKKIEEQESFIVRSLEVDNTGRIYIGYSDGWMEVFDANFKQLYSKKYTDSRIVDILVDEDKVWLASNGEVIQVDLRGEEMARYRSSVPIKSLGILNGTLHVFSYRIEVLTDGAIRSLGIPFPARIYTNYTISDTSMWLGTTEGLYHLDPSGVKKIVADEIYSDIRGIGEDALGRYWIAAAGQGVFVLQNDKVVHHLTVSDGLSSNICMHLLMDDEFVWVSTNKGINKIDIASLNIQPINEEDGLSSSEIKYLKKSNEYVIAAASGTVDILPDTIVPFTAAPLMTINHLLVNGDTMPPQGNYSFPYNSNYLTLHFTAISFKSMGNVSYAYQLEGLDKDWLETKAEAVNWSAVPPGAYRLRIKAKGSNGEWSKEEGIGIFIDFPWWKKWWFILLCALLTVGLLVFVYRRQHKRFIQENLLQKRIQNLQLTALRAQMNPHFMFNALSSIQEFINNSDLEAANLYLSRFASLVRSVLNHSTQPLISLEEEMDQLQLYLTLENLRFNQCIHYDIVVKRPIQSSKIFIPTMIIQPFVENALNHGLFHQKKEKQLKVSFTEIEGNMLHCQIEDNGIGRQRSLEINSRKKHKRQSKGIQVTRDRLELINQTNEGKIALEIEDLVDEQGEPCGTKVHLMIPFSTRNEHRK